MSSRRAEGCIDWLGSSGGSFEPDLNFIAIRIGHVSVREAGSELVTTEQW
jgi:hypothetical protein